LEKSLDAITIRYLEKWAGLAKPADLFLPQDKGGFNLPFPSALYQKLQVGKVSLLITSTDAGVNHVVQETLKKEEKQQQAKFQPHIIIQEAFASDPGASHKAVSSLAKKRIENELQDA
jgi:hypothetical protein